MPKRASSPIPTVRKKLITQGKICDNRHAHLFSNTDKSNIIYILEPRDVIKGSYIISKSLNQLDLAIGEYGRLEKMCYTKDSYWSQQFPQRYVLYKYHLDLQKKLDDYLWNNVRICYQSELYCLLQSSLHSVTTADKKPNKEDKTFCKLFRMFSFTQEFGIHCLQLIADERESRLINQLFLIDNEMVKFFFFTSYYRPLVEFTLHLTTCAKRKIFNEIYMDWRQTSTFKSAGCFYELIKYGYSYPFVPGNFLRSVRAAVNYNLDPSANFQPPSTVFLSSYHRQNLFLLTVLFRLRKSDNETNHSERLLKMFWDSIADSYLSRAEVSQGCNELQFTKDRKIAFIKFYEENISFGCTQLKPRPLVHLCCCNIRKHMGQNFEVPHGINKLEIPVNLKDYLRLSVPH
ncbi:SOCS box domain-containing protein [Trichonephila clavipes]|nr:SOCS box domain-containing protein [Trichonephila clavipes]